MTTEQLLAFFAFTLVASITPGPNNLMLMASGANFGFRRTVPHMLGITIGFIVMVALVGLGLMQVFDAYPVSYTVLKVVSFGYLLWLAWKIATASAPNGTSPAGRPMTFLQAAAFQWVNPKAWAMALTAITVYAPTKTLGAVVLVAVLFGIVNLPAIACWTTLGLQLQRLLTNPTRLIAFNVSMAALLLLSVVPMMLG